MYDRFTLSHLELGISRYLDKGALKGNTFTGFQETQGQDRAFRNQREHGCFLIFSKWARIGKPKTIKNNNTDNVLQLYSDLCDGGETTTGRGGRGQTPARLPGDGARPGDPP